MILCEEAGGGAIHVKKADHLTTYENRHSGVGTQPLLHWYMDPLRTGSGIRNDHCLPGLYHLAQIGHLGDRKDNRGDELLRTEALVSSPASNACLSLLNEHDVGSIARDHPGNLLQDVVQHLLEVEGGGEHRGGLLQRLSQLPQLSFRLEAAGVPDGNGRLSGEQAQHLGVGRGEGPRRFCQDVQHAQKLLAPADGHAHNGLEGVVIVDGGTTLPTPVVVHDERLAAVPDPAGKPFSALKDGAHGRRVGIDFHGPFQHVSLRPVEVEATRVSVHQLYRSQDDGMQEGVQIQFGGEFQPHLAQCFQLLLHPHAFADRLFPFVLLVQQAEVRFDEFFELKEQFLVDLAVAILLAVEQADGAENLTIRPEQGESQVRDHAQGDVRVLVPVRVLQGIGNQELISRGDHRLAIEAGQMLLVPRCVRIAPGFTGAKDLDVRRLGFHDQGRRHVESLGQDVDGALPLGHDLVRHVDLFAVDGRSHGVSHLLTGSLLSVSRVILPFLRPADRRPRGTAPPPPVGRAVGG